MFLGLLEKSSARQAQIALTFGVCDAVAPLAGLVAGGEFVRAAKLGGRRCRRQDRRGEDEAPMEEEGFRRAAGAPPMQADHPLPGRVTHTSSPLRPASSVEQLISVSVVGSMKIEYKPTDIVVPDQFFDRTWHRIDTFFGDGLVAHVSPGQAALPAADRPFCDAGRLGQVPGTGASHKNRTR